MPLQQVTQMNLLDPPLDFPACPAPLQDDVLSVSKKRCAHKQKHHRETQHATTEKRMNPPTTMFRTHISFTAKRPIPQTPSFLIYSTDPRQTNSEPVLGSFSKGVLVYSSSSLSVRRKKTSLGFGFFLLVSQAGKGSLAKRHTEMRWH